MILRPLSYHRSDSSSKYDFSFVRASPTDANPTCWYWCRPLATLANRPACGIN